MVVTCNVNVKIEKKPNIYLLNLSLISDFIYPDCIHSVKSGHVLLKNKTALNNF